MLDDLDAVPWSTLQHAYGPAGNVPGLLRSMASGREDGPEGALNELFGNIWHQGTVYEATAYAVPFLVELLAGSDVACKSGILQILVCVARGSSYHEAHAGLPLFREKRHTPAYQAAIEREVKWVRAAHEAVAAGAEVYLHLLAAGGPEEREHAAHVLAACGERAAVIAPRLRERLSSEQEERVRASVALALAVLGTQDDVSAFSALLRAPAGPLLRLAACVAIARVQRDELPEAAFDGLLAAAVGADRDWEAWEDFAWQDSPVLPGPSEMVTTFGASDRRRALPALLGALARLDRFCASDVAQLLLALAFERREDPVDTAALTAEQRGVVEAIADADSVWAGPMNLCLVYQTYGLPADRKALRALARGTTMGPAGAR